MRQATVFVVDDEAPICELLTRILQREGLRALPFRSGADALAAAEREAPDLVITDYLMPGMNGLEMAQRLKTLHPATGVVVISAYASLENVIEALRSGVDDYVTKPFGVADIRAVTQRVLARRQDAPPPAPRTAAPQAAAGGPPPAPPSAPASAAADPNAALARRLRDISLVEALHGLLGDEFESKELAERAAGALQAALGASRLALVVPDGGDRFRVASAAPVGTGPSEADAPTLHLILASGASSPLDSAALGDLAAQFDAGPLAAAPMRPRNPAGDDAGLLVVSRPPKARRFESEDLRVLGVAGAALGDVFHAVRAAERAEDAYVRSLLDVVAATEHRAHWFLDHSSRVRDLSLRLGKHVGLPAADVETLELASQLLDLGRLHLHDDVLAKTGRLSADEWRVLRSHPEIADALIRPLGRLRQTKPIVRHHHENWDGTGYPDRLRGEDIPYLAALVRITDAYAALTATRPWREALDPGAAVRRIVDYSGTHFHPQLVAAFAEMELAGADGTGP